MKKLEFHPATEGLPLMSPTDRNDLAADIKENGQRLPIIVLDGKVLDGRNRYLACLDHGIEPNFFTVSVKDPKAYVASLNYFRRHWSTEERKHFAALLLLAHEDVSTGKVENDSNESFSEKSVAKSLNLSRSSVQRAKAKIRAKHEQKDKNGEAEEITDASGIVVPSSAMPYWGRKSEANNVLNQIRATKRAVEAIDATDAMYCEVNMNGVIADLNNAASRFAGAIPAHVCPYCKGKAKNCKPCKSRGVVSEYFWKTAVPEEMKSRQ